MININSNNIGHHTAAFKILKNDGSTYIYGNAVYNTKKVEATFDVSGRSRISNDCKNGTISYSGNVTDNYSNNSDRYLNRVTTPAYAYGYLITAILSSDYQDITGDGLTDDDLGSYTKFTYSTLGNEYQWRVPYNKNKAMFNEGLISHPRDQKANYIYGRKQLQYIKKIETKTHVAIFNLEDRKDAIGVNGENGGGNVNTSSKMKEINTITLYSKPDYIINGINATPIKTAHFIYNYDLCPGVDNNFGGTNNNETSNNGGKLTLEKVYFTYANSKMGKHTPYVFNYANSDYNNNVAPDSNFNKPYGSKDYDIWGNYKENSDNNCGIDASDTNTAEFPFVKQDKDLADVNTDMWTLSSIDLPSGGKINLEFESDEYQYVQNKRAMQMFKVAGVGKIGLQFSNNNTLFDGNDHINCIFIKIDKTSSYQSNDFINDYLGEHIDKPIYFKFLLNMVKNTNSQYDYISGYFNIDKNTGIKITNNGMYAAIPLEMLDKESGWVENHDKVNPISKAGWYFGRTNLNRIVYSSRGDYANDDFESIVRDLLGALGTLGEIFRSPNQKLQNKGCAKTFKPNKSWVRLLNPTKRKLGGGSRVKKLQMYDNWNEMVAGQSNNDLYKQKYGQEYSYDLDDGSSSGVATFEPNGSHENPFVKPFFNAEGSKRADKLAAPKESNYVEEPIGSSFFPGATVTYSKVTVKNLERIETDANGDVVREVKKHATGKVVNEFFTSKDFPTITDYTDIMSENGAPLFDNPSRLGSLLHISVRTHLTLSQGFVIHTNDMNGKIKKQSVYAEDIDDPISSVEYKYSTNENTVSVDPNLPDNDLNVNARLHNYLPTINNKGEINNAIIGEEYDVINDFRESYSLSETYGLEFNFAGFVVPFWFVTIPTAIPQYARHENKLNLATTTKVIHTSGIMVEKIATDLGATVSTKNLAWDAVTGQVLVTKTKNEYEDAYYTINYPAHWKYKQMGIASKNLDLKGYIKKTSNEYFNISKTSESTNNINASNYFIIGDELIVKLVDSNSQTNPIYKKLWVVKVNGNKILLMDEKGKIINSQNDNYKSDIVIDENYSSFKLMRSGYRNLQSASMASVTTMTNPIAGNTNLPVLNASYKIINASAIEYSDLWSPQCECLGLPNFAYNFNKDGDLINENESIIAEIDPTTFAAINGNPSKHFNPYLYNVKGNYRAVRSYAYLTGRSTEDQSSNYNATPRKDGFFTSFSPFYTVSGSNWNTNRTGWTFASQVSKYSPYGVELENKDALGRYSSAQYGFNYTLPTAVSSNSKYTEMGYDSFEDYDSEDCTNTHFGFKQAATINNVSIDNKTSHTGRNSIKVNPGSRATLTKRIEDCDNNN